MLVKVNREIVKLEDRSSIIDLIRLKYLHFATVIVTLNQNLVKKEEWSNVVLQESDEIQILRFVGGG